MLKIIKSLPDQDEGGSEVEFVWIDVACIDQRDGAREKELEIRRQAVIFERAYQVFAWLRTYSNDELRPLWEKYELGSELLYTIEWGSEITQDQRDGLEMMLESTS